MNEPRTVVDAQLRHLVAVVTRHRDARCAEILERAAEQAEQEVKRAHQEARMRMKQAVAETRDSLRRQLTSAEARRQTQERQKRQQADKALLVEVWSRLPDALAGRWRDGAGRRRWINGLLAQAAAVLVDRQWLVEHPSDWSEQERVALEAQLRERLGQTPRFAPQPDITAGLRIRAGGACVDGTLDGLLSEREAIEARLLAAIHAGREGVV